MNKIDLENKVVIVTGGTAAKIPRNRFAKVEELASMVFWMISDENSFTIGAVFDLSEERATY